MNLVEKILSVIKGNKEEKKEILIIDNRFHSLEFLKNALCQRYKILIAQDKDEGISRARLYRPSMIIMNSKLNKDSTLDLCALFRKFYEIKNVPILMITAKGDDSKIAEFYTYKIEGFLIEPFSKGELLNQVRTIFLDRGQS